MRALDLHRPVDRVQPFHRFPDRAHRAHRRCGHAVPLLAAIVFSLLAETLRLKLPQIYMMSLGLLLILSVLFLPGGLASLRGETLRAWGRDMRAWWRDLPRRWRGEEEDNEQRERWLKEKQSGVRL